MIGRGLVRVLAAMSASAALALDPGKPPIVPPPAPEPMVATHGWLAVTDPGCVAGANEPAHTDWPEEGRAVHTLTIWLSTRESVVAGPVEVAVETPRISAWIPVQVEALHDGAPVPTCIRPVTLELTVSPLPRGDYDWDLQRGPRPVAAAADTTRSAPSAQD